MVLPRTVSTIVVSCLLVILLPALLPAARAAAQDTRTGRPVGRIVGRVIDAATGHGISDVGIQVVGTTSGTVSGVDGRFAIPKVGAGTVALRVRRLGYQPKTVTGLEVRPGGTVEQSITLEATTVMLTAQVVTASAERGSVSETLDAQRTATGIVSAVSSEQIAKSPDGDAAQAARRVSGVTVQRGGHVFVRGLGERYTTAQLNGARVPSPDPEKRTVPLDLFPSSLLSTVATSKTFTPDQPGDFSGAQLELRTREFPALRQVTWQFTTGYAPGTTGRTMLQGFTAGGEQLALTGSRRRLPALLRAVGNFEGLQLTQADKNLLVSEFRNAWTPSASSASPNVSTAVGIGGNDPILGLRLGYLLSATYSLAYDRRAEQVRALANRGATPGETIETDRFEGETGSSGVRWGGLANFSTLLGEHTRLMFNNTYSRTADNDARREIGALENEGIRARIDRMQYVERAMYSTQLGAEHQLGRDHQVDWSATWSTVTRDEPDRTEFVHVIERDTPEGPDVLRWLNSGNAGAVRTFAELDEHSLEGRVNYRLTLPLLGRRHALRVGALYRDTDRDAETRAYSISAPRAGAAVRELAPEALFDGRFFGPADSVFDIVPLSQGGAYAARDELTAGYVMADVGLADRVRLIGGIRYERDRLAVRAISTLGDPVYTTRDWRDALPSLTINVALGDVQNLRLSVSRTLARPEYRELVPIRSRDVLNGDDLEGNPALERTEVRNADLRWEWYPSSGEVVSVAAFAKHFEAPIERVYRAAGASSRFIGFVNAEEAVNYGLEFELRKGLGALHPLLAPLAVFTNLTVMHSAIELGAGRAAATNPERRMVGQAPYVLNLGLAYVSASGGTSATLLFNRVGERIDAAGDQPLPDVIQLPRDVLDFSLRFPIAGAFSGRFDARNLLDSPYHTVQGTVTRESWRTGRVFQAGIVWRP